PRADRPAGPSRPCRTESGRPPDKCTRPPCPRTRPPPRAATTPGGGPRPPGGAKRPRSGRRCRPVVEPPTCRLQLLPLAWPAAAFPSRAGPSEGHQAVPIMARSPHGLGDNLAADADLRRQLRHGRQAADRPVEDGGREPIPPHLDRAPRGRRDPDEAPGRLNAAPDDPR